MRGPGQRGEVVRDPGRVVEGAREQGVVDPVRRDVGGRVGRPLGLGQGAVDREDDVDLGQERALGGDGLVAIEVREHRPLVDAVVDRQRLAQGPDVVGDVGQEGPQVEVAEAEAPAQAADRRAEGRAVDAGGRSRCGAGAGPAGENTQRSFSTRTGPRANSPSLRRILPRSRPLVSWGARVPTELSHRTRRVFASSRRTWWFEVGSSCQSFANAMIPGAGTGAERSGRSP